MTMSSPRVYPRLRTTLALTVLAVALAVVAWLLSRGSTVVPSPVDGELVERSLSNAGWLFVSVLATTAAIPAAVKTVLDIRLRRRHAERR